MYLLCKILGCWFWVSCQFQHHLPQEMRVQKGFKNSLMAHIGPNHLIVSWYFQIYYKVKATSSEIKGFLTYGVCWPLYQMLECINGVGSKYLSKYNLHCFHKSFCCFSQRVLIIFIKEGGALAKNVGSICNKLQDLLD